MKLFRTSDHTATDDDTRTGDTATGGETSRQENGDMAMSQEPTVPDDDEQASHTGLVSEREPAAGGPAPAHQATGALAYQDAGIAADQPRPTFTPTAARDDAVTDSPAYGSAATTPADDSPAALPVDEPVAAFSADEPLLANAVGRRASWQKVQAEFVDDPQAAVMDAADLIEQTAQSLVDAVQQRQRQLRLQSDRGTGNGGGTVAGAAGYDPAVAGGAPDTEHLRLMMQRYRTLFDQLCRA